MNPEKQKLLFTVCTTKEELNAFLQVFLKIRLPYQHVDPDSTSDALNCVWEVCRSMQLITGMDDETSITQRNLYMDHVLAAARDTAKTLVASICAFLGLIHYRRQVTHLAATFEQSKAMIRYLNRYLSIPEVAQFVKSDTDRTKNLIGMPPSMYPDGRVFSTTSEALVVVAVATPKGCNSQRGSLVLLDEVDLVPQRIIDEYIGVSDQTRDGRPPVYVAMSSRKTSQGSLQGQLDKASEANSIVMAHKWSIADWMQACVRAQGLPDFRVDVNVETLETYWDCEQKPASAPTKPFIATELCKKCGAWNLCHGLARFVRQQTPMLKPLLKVTALAQKIRSIDILVSQYLNWRPSDAGLIYYMFKPDKHLKNPEWLYRYITNSDWPCEHSPTQQELYRAAKEHDWVCNIGVDYEYAEDASYCVTLFDSRTDRCVVLQSDKSASLGRNFSTGDWSQWVIDNVCSQFPPDAVAPDTIDMSAAPYFQSRGYYAIPKKPPRIEPGVSFIRGLLMPAATLTPQLYIMHGSNDFLIEELMTWSKKKGAMGYVEGSFEEGNDHVLDALRYALAPFVVKRDNTICMAPDDEDELKSLLPPTPFTSFDNPPDSETYYQKLMKLCGADNINESVCQQPEPLHIIKSCTGGELVLKKPLDNEPKKSEDIQFLF